MRNWNAERFTKATLFSKCAIPTVPEWRNGSRERIAAETEPKAWKDRDIRALGESRMTQLLRHHASDRRGLPHAAMLGRAETSARQRTTWESFSGTAVRVTFMKSIEVTATISA